MKTLLIIISSAAVFTLTQEKKVEQPEKTIRKEVSAAYNDSVLKENRTLWMKDKMK